eukprot:TRINITY_DN65938_c9_g3_i1.p1 TRINITY_DN65938_c9_g3~~TRINITY_DN65938_c9_g3_i1.p1  ORF type:complete len:106 (-),score=0.83 TRINITY_DN65938_c9_g3_i1:243-560(-)
MLMLTPFRPGAVAPIPTIRNVVFNPQATDRLQTMRNAPDCSSNRLVTFDPSNRQHRVTCMTQDKLSMFVAPFLFAIPLGLLSQLQPLIIIHGFLAPKDVAGFMML